jgi:hypothetical protein
VENSNNHLNSIKYSDMKHFDNKSSSSPNDEGRGTNTPYDDGSAHYCSRSLNTFDECENDGTTTSMV